MTAAALGRFVAAAAAILAGSLPLAASPAASGSSSPASGTTASLQARAAAIAASVAADTARLQRLGSRYVAEEATQAAAHAAAGRLTAEVARTTGRIHQETAIVRRAAINAYVTSDNAAGLALALDQRPDELVVGRTYLDVAAAHLRESAQRLAGERRQLRSELGRERHAEASAAAALSAIGTARSGALAAYADERRRLASVHGELAALVAAQAARRAAAERAALLAAERRAAARAAAARAAAATTLPTTTLVATGAHGAGTGTGAGAAPGTTVTTAPAAPPPPAAGAPAPSGPPDPSGSAVPGIPTGSIAADFAGIRNCESGDDYSLDTGNGYYGAYQFSLATWDGLGETGLPSDAPPSVQDAAAYHLYQLAGWGSWPACSALLGLR